MSISEYIKKIRVDKILKQKAEYNGLDLKPAHYNNLVKGLTEPTIEFLDNLASFFGVFIDESDHYIKATSKYSTIKGKLASEQVHSIAQLNNTNKSTVMNSSNSLLTKQKFHTFFKQNIQNAK